MTVTQVLEGCMDSTQSLIKWKTYKQRKGLVCDGSLHENVPLVSGGGSCKVVNLIKIVAF